jgi:hypothetical protein
MMRTCQVCFVAGVCVCGGAIAASAVGEVHHTAVSLYCAMPPEAPPDFGPPEGCSDGSLPHNRSVQFASLAVTASTGTGPGDYYMPLVALTANDTEDAWRGHLAPSLSFSTLSLWAPRPVTFSDPKFVVAEGIPRRVR